MYQEPQLDDGRRVRQRRHRRHHPAGRGPPRVVPAEHERQALHLQRLRLPVGGRHRQPRLPGPLGRQRGRQAEGGPVGRRPRRRRQPDDGVPLSRRRGGKVPDRRGLSARHRLRARPHRPAAARAGQARDPQLRRLAGLSAAPSPPGSSTSPAAWRSTSRSTANRRARATSPAPTGTTSSALLKETQATGQAVPRHLALEPHRPRRGPLRLGDDAARRERLCLVRAARGLHQGDLVPRVRLRPRRAPRQGDRAGRRRPPARVRARPRARQPHQGERGRAASAVATAAPACAPRAPR